LWNLGRHRPKFHSADLWIMPMAVRDLLPEWVNTPATSA